PQTYITNEIGLPYEEIEQIDTYFQSPIKDFQQTDEALRIRQISTKEKTQTVEITYKGPKMGNDMKVREELTISTKKYSDTLKIFEQLGFRAIADIKKKRVNWKKDSIIISLDELIGLGTFIEAEMIVSKNSNDISSSKEEIIDFLKKVFPRWSGKEERSSYLELLIGII
ncbi:MAG: class IV adenylate cyclase, partial [Candidatus Heimdallarchaeota archaeon]|nr:class IV adenylate cyclase [Candidatus Heimdallarchaeota archaeon]